jgi:hypothetical protein
MNMNVQTPVSGGENPCPFETGLDIGELQTQTLRILGAFELIGSLVTSAIGNPNHEQEAFLNHVELVASTFADMTCDVLDSLSRAA